MTQHRDQPQTVDEPAPARPKGRGLGRVVLGLCAIALAIAAAGGFVRDVARAIGQRVAGVGQLEWWDGAGWRGVSADEARRRTWGPGDAFLLPGWRSAAPGLAVADLRLRRPPNPLEVDVLLARVDPSAWELRVWGRPDFRVGSVRELAEEAGLSLAVNASYFSEDGPLGLVVSDGEARGRQGRNRAAHFVVDGDGRPRIVNEKGAALGTIAQGFQGFPAIMTAGKTFSYMRYGGRGFNVWTVDRRTAGCTLASGDVVLLATDTVTNGLSLDELATVLGGLGCVDAMAFDGGSSTGMVLTLPGEVRVVENLAPVPVIVGVGARR